MIANLAPLDWPPPLVDATVIPLSYPKWFTNVVLHYSYTQSSCN